MSNFVSNNPDENSTPLAAMKLVRQRGMVGLQSFGIVANPGGSLGAAQMLESEDFAANGITPDTPARLLIRTQKGREADADNSVAGFGEYINVAMTIRMIDGAPNIAVGIERLMANEGRVINMNDLPGVSNAQVAAIIAAWNEA